MASMNVYLLIHDDRMYDMGDTYVRGVYARREDAEASIISRTASGAVSRAHDAHSASCCSVDEQEVTAGATVDVKSDPPPPSPSDERLIPDRLVTSMLRASLRPGPFRHRT